MPLPKTATSGRQLTLGAVITAIALASLGAHAITPTGDKAGPVPRATKPAHFAPPTTSVAATLELVSGTITAIDRAKKSMTVAGTALTWHNARLRVFGANGVAMSEHDLAPGARVRFAFEPGNKESRVIVLVYVDAQP